MSERTSKGVAIRWLGGSIMLGELGIRVNCLRLQVLLFGRIQGRCVFFFFVVSKVFGNFKVIPPMNNLGDSFDTVKTKDTLE